MFRSIQSLDHFPPGEGPSTTANHVAGKPSVSCLACKKRKSKCSRQSPCDACYRHGTDCVYDVISDQRRKVAHARAVHDLQRCRHFLGGIIALFRVGGPEAREHFLTTIRQDRPIEELAHYVEYLVRTEPAISHAFQQSSLILEKATDTEVTPPVSGPPMKSYLQYNEVHTPIIMESMPWTMLADNEMVSHLLSLFFTWQQPSCQYVDKTAFLTDMSTQDTTRPKTFCSPLLVNAILAQACSISPRRAECELLQADFSREVKRLLELECGRATLTTMQALLVTYSVECDRGQDRVGRSLRFQAVDMYRRLGYDQEQPRPRGCDTSENVQQDWRALTRIIWAVFCHDGLTCFLYGFELSLKVPLVEQYFLHVPDSAGTELDARDGHWTAYPMARSLQPALLTPVLQAQILLAEIFYKVILVDQAPSVTVHSLAQITDLLQQLVLWREGLDPRLRMNDNSTAQVYHLNIWYHLIHVVIAKQLWSRPGMERPPAWKSPQEILLIHATASMDSLWQFRSAFSFRYSTGIGLFAPIVTSYSLIAHLHGRADIAALFTRAVQAIREHGHLTIVPFLLAGLRALERSHSIKLPPEVQGYMRVLEGLKPDLSDVPMEMPVIVVPNTRQNMVITDDWASAAHRVRRLQTLSSLLKQYSKAILETASPVVEHGRSW
ncbi:hypothetical protein EDD36DRAFT_118270 [Exophiala viscosa]|uniref:Zn(2)-C6 fungal-type domain-containing protein n=1 Tax=Exophiala viscosa TaxID=2486360 RepID=A0AAN6DLN2_9EURO|nr:hypothetical protein EDD36DRAFT_118270 [Exophiala viscosa]